jgi:parallel beta-helix repeat protein
MTMIKQQPARQGRKKVPSAPMLFLLLLLFAIRVPAQTATKNATILTLPASADGLTIQQALDTAPAGGEVRLAPGIYEIHHPLILQHDGQVLRGSGAATVLMLADKGNCPVVILGAPTATTKHATARLRLSDLSIDGNRTKQDGELWRLAVDGSLLNNNGIEVWNAVDATVERVICFRCRSGGLVASAGTRRLTVNDFTAYDNQFDGLACYYTEGSRFTRLFLHDNHGAGISLDLAFNQNDIEDAVLSDNDLGVFMRYSRDNTFKNLTIHNSRHHGVFMAQAGGETANGWQFTAGTECTGNNFARINVTNCGGRAFVVNDASCTNNPVTEAHYLQNAGDILVRTETKVTTTLLP